MRLCEGDGFSPEAIPHLTVEKESPTIIPLHVRQWGWPKAAASRNRNINLNDNNGFRVVAFHDSLLEFTNGVPSKTQRNAVRQYASSADHLRMAAEAQ